MESEGSTYDVNCKQHEPDIEALMKLKKCRHFFLHVVHHTVKFYRWQIFHEI